MKKKVLLFALGIEIVIRYTVLPKLVGSNESWPVIIWAFALIGTMYWLWGFTPSRPETKKYCN